MKILIYIYCVLYALFLIWTIIEAFQSEDPWWETLSDVVLLPLGGIGMVLFLLSVSDPFLKSIWRVVAIAIVVGQLLTNVISRHRMLTGQTEQDPEKISQWAILGADLTTIVFLAPMIALNFLYAFS